MNPKKLFSTTMSTCNIICAILVIFIHAYNITIYNCSNSFVFWLEQVISQGIAKGSVPFFFMSSAFFLYSSKKSIRNTYKSRFISTAIPYLLWNLIYMIIFTILHNLSLTSVGMDKITFNNILSGIFLHKYNYTYWFMKWLIIWILLYPVIRWIISRGKVFAVIVGIASVLLYYMYPTEFETIKLDTFLFYYPGAVAGYYYRDKLENMCIASKIRKTVIFIAILIVASIFFITDNIFMINTSAAYDFIMALLIFFTVNCFTINVSCFIAALSFMVYSMHPVILEMLEKMIYLYCHIHRYGWL